MSTNENTQSNDGIRGINWLGNMLLSFIVGGIGGFIITAYGFEIGYRNMPEPTIFCLIGIAFLVLSMFVWLGALEDLIASAHVHALEVFYGKKRKIQN